MSNVLNQKVSVSRHLIGIMEEPLFIFPSVVFLEPIFIKKITDNCLTVTGEAQLFDKQTDQQSFWLFYTKDATHFDRKYIHKNGKLWRLSSKADA